MSFLISKTFLAVMRIIELMLWKYLESKNVSSDLKHLYYYFYVLKVLVDLKLHCLLDVFSHVKYHFLGTKKIFSGKGGNFHCLYFSYFKINVQLVLQGLAMAWTSPTSCFRVCHPCGTRQDKGVPHPESPGLFNLPFNFWLWEMGLRTWDV